MYDNPETFDDADLSDVIIDEPSFLNTLAVLSAEALRMTDIDAKILKAGNAFGSIRTSLFGSQYVHDSPKVSVYESLILQ